MTANSYTVRSTINPQLQRAVETTLQEGWSRYERSAGRVQFVSPEARLGKAVQRADAERKVSDKRPAWQIALATARLPLYDVHWTPAIVVEKPGGGKKNEAWRVGLADGRVLPFSVDNAIAQRKLAVYDVVLVRVTDGKGKAGARAELRVRPIVQGAVVVLENKTGRILAMAGGFSYPLSQLNRTSQTQRQPGSAIKPVTYLTALQKGLQPNTLIPDEPLTLPPIGNRFGAYDTGVISRVVTNAREEDYWTPRNYGYTSGGIYTMRRGLENSVNIVTARLLEGGIEAEPERSLDDICATAVAAKIYADCVRYYPFVLGAQPVRMIDLAAFYAAIANGGVRPQPHAIDSIEKDGKTVFAYPKDPVFPKIGAADPASFYQLKTMLQGVVARGTARAIGALSPYVAGKTGTTEDAVDGWFVGFTNDVTVAIWVGYDNGDGKRRSLGGVDGARVALPIFKPIIEDIWSDGIAPKALLNGPSPEAKRDLVDLPIDYMSGNVIRGAGARGDFVEHFRIGPNGQFADTQNQLVSAEAAAEQRQEQAYAAYNGPGYQGGAGAYGGAAEAYDGRYYSSNGDWRQQPPPQPRGLFGNWTLPGFQQQPPPAPPPPSGRGYYAPYGNNPTYGAQRPPPRGYYGGGGYD